MAVGPWTNTPCGLAEDVPLEKVEQPAANCPRSHNNAPMYTSEKISYVVLNEQ